MPQNVVNFLRSKDSLYNDYSIRYKLVFLAFILFFTILEIIFYFFNISFFCRNITLLDIIVAILFSVFGLTDFIVACSKNSIRVHYVYYGIIILLLSCFLFYSGTRSALFLFSEWFGLLGIAFWIILSIICIFAVICNVKNNFYDKNCKKNIWFPSNSDGNNERYGIVVSGYTITAGIITIVYVVGLAIMFFTSIATNYPDMMSGQDSKALIMSQLLIFVAYFFLGFCAHFAWKLIVKNSFSNKYATHSYVN